MKTLLLVLTLTLTASTPTKPELRRHESGSRYTAFNPLRKAILMSIGCLGDYEKLDVPLGAGTSLELEIKQPNGYAASCYMAGYAVKD